MAFVITSSGVFEGNDGPWSTFQVDIGTPQSTVNILPSNSLNYIIASDASLCQGLTATDRNTCLNLRGGENYANYSASFLYEGLYKLPFPCENQLPPLQCSGGACNNAGEGYFADAASLVGTDFVSLASYNGKNRLVQNQLIASYAGAEPDIGFLGLSTTQAFAINSSSPPYDNPLQALWDAKLTPSRYWAYNAGSYQKTIDGSLTIGGYDQNRGDLSNAPYWKFAEDSQNFAVKISSISINEGYLAPFTASIDTTVPELWLPTSVCTIFESVFGLTWNETLYMYMVSDQQRQKLRHQDQTVTFTLGGLNLHGADAGQEITLSYSNSFDLQVKWPLGGIEVLNETRNYFPLKRAQSEDQYTLGRAFFQETYLAVDHDRERFCIAPSKVSDTVDIVTVNNRRSDIVSVNHRRSGLSSGAIAGIAVGGVVVLLGAALVVFFMLRKRRREKKNAVGSGREEPRESSMSEPMPAPLGGYYRPGDKAELYSDARPKRLRSDSAELHGSYPERRDHRRTLSGDTLQPVSPLSRGNPRDQIHSRTLSEESHVQSLQSFQSQGSHQSPLPSPPAELGAGLPAELEGGWRPGEVDVSPPRRLEEPRGRHDLPSQFTIQG